VLSAVGDRILKYTTNCRQVLVLSAVGDRILKYIITNCRQVLVLSVVSDLLQAPTALSGHTCPFTS
jgi:hypothetical protein